MVHVARRHVQRQRSKTYLVDPHIVELPVDGTQGRLLLEHRILEVAAAREPSKSRRTLGRVRIVRHHRGREGALR